MRSASIQLVLSLSLRKRETPNWGCAGANFRARPPARSVRASGAVGDGVKMDGGKEDANHRPVGAGTHTISVPYLVQQAERNICGVVAGSGRRASSLG